MVWIHVFLKPYSKKLNFLKFKGKIKLEKFKSTLNGITVRRIFDIKTGDVITSEYLFLKIPTQNPPLNPQFFHSTTLFSYEKCSHPVKSKDMCAICGEDLRKR